MPLRGPYKQYEVDTSISVPKSTSYDRRKRRLVEVLIDELMKSMSTMDKNVLLNRICR